MKTITSFALLALLAVVFSAVAVYNLPQSYITSTSGTFAHAVVSPYLRQSWSLFAPNPGTFKTDALFRYAVESSPGHYTVSSWYDGNALFPVTYGLNPLNRMSAEREMYFGEVLLATNNIHTLRLFAKKHARSVGSVALATSTPREILSVARMFMSLEPALQQSSAGQRFYLQIALREIPIEDFARRFNDTLLATQKTPSGSIVLPWLIGSAVPSFYQEVQRAS